MQLTNVLGTALKKIENNKIKIKKETNNKTEKEKKTESTPLIEEIDAKVS